MGLVINENKTKYMFSTSWVMRSIGCQIMADNYITKVVNALTYFGSRRYYQKQSWYGY